MVTNMPGFPISAILAALTLAIGYDGMRLLQDQEFNHAVATGDEESITGREDTHGQFLNAYRLQQQRDFRKAVRAYAAIDARSRSPLQTHIKYNLANLYFREALRMRETGSNDLAMPLIELAKQNYKEILRIDDNNWDAKFNLELALILAPEMDPADALEERNPEHSPRALTTIKSREPLP